MFWVRSRAVGAVFDDFVAFFRPTYSHVREEKQRLLLNREDIADAAPPLRVGGVQFTVSLPKDYQPPEGVRGPRHPE